MAVYFLIMHQANERRNKSNIQDWWFIPNELNVAHDCSRVMKHNTLTNKYQSTAGAAFLFQQNIDVEIDVGKYRISQYLNFKSNVTINIYSKETSMLNQQPEKQSHCNIRVNWENYSPFSKLIDT